MAWHCCGNLYLHLPLSDSDRIRLLVQILCESLGVIRVHHLVAVKTEPEGCGAMLDAPSTPEIGCRRPGARHAPFNAQLGHVESIEGRLTSSSPPATFLFPGLTAFATSGLLVCSSCSCAAPRWPRPHRLAAPQPWPTKRGALGRDGVARRRPTSHEPDSDLCRLVSNESGP